MFFSYCVSVLGDSLQDNKDATEGEAGGQASLISWHSYIGIPINIHKSQASSPFEAMNSAHLLMCQKDVRPSVQKRWRTMSFSRVSTGDSVISSSCEMKYEPAFKPLQGNPGFF